MLLFSALSLCFILFLQLALCAEDFYKLLGLDKSCSERDIKRAYKNLSKKFHPDKNPGDENAHQKFMEVSEAYETLSDKELRKIYDQYGREGLEQHKQGRGAGSGRHDPFDLFSRFFGGSGHFGGHPGVRRGPDMEVRVGLPLRDFYNGKQLEFSVEKQQICEDCEGSGSADGIVETCDRCGGRGIIIQKHQLAPGMFQQVQMHCDKCGGKGKSIKHLCPICNGQRVVRRPTQLHAHIERGMPVGHRIIFENEADESPDWEAGNMIVTLSENDPVLSGAPAPGSDEDDHRNDGVFFRRKGSDLYWREILSLREAWMGDWTRNLTHLDGHVIQLSRPAGSVIQPNSVETVLGEGMPLYSDDQHIDHDSSDGFGKLFVEYIVVLPDQMDSGMQKDFHAVWEKYRKKNGRTVGLDVDAGRPGHDPMKIRKVGSGGGRGNNRDEL